MLYVGDNYVELESITSVECFKKYDDTHDDENDLVSRNR